MDTKAVLVILVKTVFSMGIGVSGPILIEMAIMLYCIGLSYLSTESVNLTWIVVLLVVGGTCATIAVILLIYISKKENALASFYWNYAIIPLFAAALITEWIFILVSSAWTVEQFNYFVDNEALGRMGLYNSNTAAREEWNNFQKIGQCCGLDGYTDWQGIQEYPSSCCQDSTVCSPEKDDFFPQGCRDVLKEKFFLVIRGLWITAGLAAALHSILLLIVGTVWALRIIDVFYQSLLISPDGKVKQYAVKV